MTSEQITDLAIKVLPGIATAIVAAFLSSRWSLRRLLADKWWTRKEHAYSEIIDALYDLLQYTEIKKEDYGDGAGFSENRMKELADLYSAAIWKIKRATAIGAFVISDESAEILTTLRSRPELNWDENPPWDVYDDEHLGYKTALDEFRTAARNDLRRGRV